MAISPKTAAKGTISEKVAEVSDALEKVLDIELSRGYYHGYGQYTVDVDEFIHHTLPKIAEKSIRDMVWQKATKHVESTYKRLGWRDCRYVIRYGGFGNNDNHYFIFNEEPPF